jgi:hypothetical protein
MLQTSYQSTWTLVCGLFLFLLIAVVIAALFHSWQGARDAHRSLACSVEELAALERTVQRHIHGHSASDASVAGPVPLSVPLDVPAPASVPDLLPGPELASMWERAAQSFPESVSASAGTATATTRTAPATATASTKAFRGETSAESGTASLAEPHKPEPRPEPKPELNPEPEPNPTEPNPAADDSVLGAIRNTLRDIESAAKDLVFGHRKHAVVLGEPEAEAKARTGPRAKSAFAPELDAAIDEALARKAGAALRPLFPASEDTLADDWSIISVGLNYTWSPPNRLDSCWNDARELETLVLTRYAPAGTASRIRRISDQPSTTSASASAPTRANLRAALADALHRAMETDRAGRTPCIAFLYSGHGFFAWTDDPAELSGKKECFMLQDGAYWDHELYAEFIALLPASARVLLVSDACHSESNANLPFSYNPVSKRLNLCSLNVRTRAACVALSACRDEQTAQSGAMPTDCSAFTRELVKWLRNPRPMLARDGIPDLRARLQRAGDLQVPTLSISRPELLDVAL